MGINLLELLTHIDVADITVLVGDAAIDSTRINLIDFVVFW